MKDHFVKGFYTLLKKIKPTKIRPLQGNGMAAISKTHTQKFLTIQYGTRIAHICFVFEDFLTISRALTIFQIPPKISNIQKKFQITIFLVKGCCPSIGQKSRNSLARIGQKYNFVLFPKRDI